MAEQHGKALVPQIRFAGFTDPWEQRKLGELFEESDERASDREILSVSVANGIYPASESDRETNPGASLANYKIVHFGDVVYNSMRMWQGAVDASRYDGIVSPAYVVTRPNSEVYARFFARLLRQPMLLKQYQQVSQGNSKDTQVLKFDDFASIGISMPASENEQRQIGAFFDRLDSLITLHQRKYDKLCVLKKSMLDKMFPKGGSLYPEIRFAGFTDPWEQRKLGEVATFGGGHTPSMSDSDNYEGGNVLWVTSQDVKSHYLDGTTTQITEKGAKELTLYPAGSLVMVTRSGILRHTLPVAELRKPSTVNQDIRVILPQENYYGQWLLQFFISRNKELLLEFGKTGTTVESVDFSKMRDMVLLTPSLPEQQQIGRYFARLDNLITLHQRKLELLRNIKKSMLDKMFV
ncbi:restriction endonuclease subunit S [Bifidobacterium adolescentis]|nr:restriction endonuclease subunit S [Bifidobacterium adolescentis]